MVKKGDARARRRGVSAQLARAQTDGAVGAARQFATQKSRRRSAGHQPARVWAFVALPFPVRVSFLVALPCPRLCLVISCPPLAPLVFQLL
eukprot:5609033-Pleurochrysis_carterae.AAC.1